MSNKCTEEKIKSPNLYSVGMKSLTIESAVKAKEIFKETDESKQTAIEKLRQMLGDGDVYLDENDDYLLRFLRYRKYNLQRTVQTLKHHSDLASTIMSTIGLPKPETVRKVLELNAFGILPYKDLEGRTVMYFQDAAYFFHELKLKEQMQMIVFTSFFLIQDPNAQINGLTGILNAEELSLGHLPGYFRLIKLILHLLKCNPVGFKKIYVVNAKPLTYILMKIVKPLAPLKLLQRTSFHSDTEILKKDFHSSMLPTEFGGTLGPACNDHWLHNVEPICNLLKNYILKYAS